MQSGQRLGLSAYKWHVQSERYILESFVTRLGEGDQDAGEISMWRDKWICTPEPFPNLKCRQVDRKTR